MDVCKDDILTLKKLRMIRNHLNLVKAAEKEGLGSLNTQIYTLISRHIDMESDEQRLRKLKAEISQMLKDFLTASFPDGHEDSE